MRPLNFLSRAGSALTFIGAAASAAAAAAEQQPPHRRHLRRLGIDPAQFEAIGR
jgi:hypothetical protein